MSAQTLGALSVSAKEDGKALANGILTPTMLDSINEAIKIEGKNSNKAAKAIIDRHQKNLDYYMQTKGDMPPDVDEPDDDTATTAPPAATPTTAPGWGTATPVR
jgi:hypothetical protein